MPSNPATERFWTGRIFDERERAATHYEAAIESSQRIGARPHLVRTQYAYGRMLLDADPTSSDERGTAREMLARAEATAGELGLKRLLEQNSRLLSQLPG